MNTIIARPTNNEKANALKAVLKALKIQFEEAADDTPYNPEFVAKINESRQQAKEGKVTRVKKEEFKTYLGL